MASQIAGPTTVNGASLGKAESFRTDGPATVCMRNMKLTVEAGQSAYLGYSGIHSGKLRLVTGRGSVEFDHGEIFADHWRKELLFKAGAAQVYLGQENGDGNYLFVMPAKDGRRRVQVIADGSGFRGNREDYRLLRQVTLGDEDATGCTRTYAYGWGVLLEGEPFFQDR